MFYTFLRILSYVLSVLCGLQFIASVQLGLWGQATINLLFLALNIYNITNLNKHRSLS